MASNFLYSTFMITLFTIIGLLQQLINEIFFFVNTQFLKSMAFSLLCINLIQYFDVQKAKFGRWFMRAFYGLYCLLSFLLPFYENGFDALKWYEWIMLIPFLMVAFFGTYLKFTRFGRRWLNYYAMHIYYSVISILICLIIPSYGSWYGIIIYSVILLVFSNIGGLWKDDAIV